jgi:hypothetical protein
MFRQLLLNKNKITTVFNRDWGPPNRASKHGPDSRNLIWWYRLTCWIIPFAAVHATVEVVMQ